ncbi:phosphoribosyltransferase [Natrinema longum]|uniref:phosphoribosyltransferase n=1 Tax=Natrinema longum TaxID=370324 RepID=UPI001CCD5796|nr:phosphoribosyltransferase family protein [Natrinema longum]MBZ6497057.1 phosphoribosyltransferase [Natrinema longum]
MEPDRQFRDRTEAGEQLADALQEREIDADIALAIPRGGLPLGRAVADALDVPLDIVVAKKIGASGNPEFAIGAVASDGSVWRNEKAFRGTGSDEEYFQEQREEEAKNARQKAERYRGDRAEPDLTDKTVVVVDDGVATGSTVRACLRKFQGSDADRLVLAVPVGPPDTIDELEDETDEVVCLETPAGFRGVGQFYANFGQVSDEEAMSYLER